MISMSSAHLSVVLIVRDVLAPGHRAPGLVGLLHRNVDHEPIRRGTMPVLLVRLEVDAVAGVDDLDRPAPALAAADALRDPDGLTERVRVPGGAGTRSEVHVGRLKASGRGRRGDRIDVDRAGEPV